MNKLSDASKEEINNLATTIVNALKENSSVLMNIQVEEEFSQYDVLFSYNFTNYGIHQRGILAVDLIISIISFGSYGFRTDVSDTEPGYYYEKLGVRSNFLSALFNEVRKRIK